MWNLRKGLPRLENLFIKQSHLARRWNWRALLSFPSIEFVGDVTWSRSCDQCNITRTSLNPNVTPDPCRGNCTKTTMYFSKGRTDEENSGEICWFESFTSYHSPSRYLSPGFTLQCLCDPRNCTTHSPFALLFQLVQRLMDCLYPLASVGLLLNSVVILLVSTSKDLRKSPTMFLILNMAVCDFFMGLWCVLTATFNLFPDNDDEFAKSNHYGIYSNRSFNLMCPYMSFIFGVIQFTTVMMSLFLTVERYLVIVYSMNPDVRMTKNISAICVCVTWCTAIAYNIYSVFLLSHEQWVEAAINFSLCTVSFHKTIYIFYIFLGGLYILIFLCTIPLYIHMYIVVRKSSTQMGVKREGVLARKLSLLVLTNFLFSTIPLSLGPLFSKLYIDLFSYETFSSIKAGTVSSVWVPVLLLCLNSCLNPFLFAFQHHLFKRHFRKTCETIRQHFIKEQTAPADQQVNEQRCRNTERSRPGETAV